MSVDQSVPALSYNPCGRAVSPSRSSPHDSTATSRLPSERTTAGPVNARGSEGWGTTSQVAPPSVLRWISASGNAVGPLAASRTAMVSGSSLGTTWY